MLKQKPVLVKALRQIEEDVKLPNEDIYESLERQIQCHRRLKEMQCEVKKVVQPN